jgi:hypothetical protein
MALLMVITSSCHFKTPGASLLSTPGNMSVRFSASSTTWFNRVEWAMVDYAFSTVLTPRLSRGNCSSEWHRICIFTVNEGNSGRGGYYQCQPGHAAGSHPRQTCSHGYVVFNTYYDWSRYGIGLACHEVGHGVGLSHRGADNRTSCMNGSRWVSTTLDNHDREEINNYYRSRV